MRRARAPAARGTQRPEKSAPRRRNSKTAPRLRAGGTIHQENAMDKDPFTAVTERLFKVAKCKTQLQLANFMGIRQSSVSDAIRRKSIPAEWLLTLLRHDQTNPDWVLTGKGPRYLRPGEDKAPTVVHVTKFRPAMESSTQELLAELMRRERDQRLAPPRAALLA